MTGCPSTYAQDIAAEICALVVEGDILNKICRRDGMLALRTVQGWLRDRPEFGGLGLSRKVRDALTLLVERARAASGKAARNG